MTEPCVTRALARWASGCELDDIPESVRREAVRTFVNWVGCAVGGSDQETVERAVAAVRPFFGPQQATVLGRTERVDVLHAALLNGISSHVLDYDDTHLKTIIHPASPVISAAFAAAEMRPVTGADLLTAVIVGIEACCRIGNVVYPDHYDRGWHITGTAGVFGAAVAVSRLLRLNEQRMSWSLGLAATQASGLREMFGTMTKSFHPGRAAQSGALAAFLAEAGFDSSERAIEAPRGFANVLATKQDYAEITDGLGEHWETALNTYKPFACGIVIHPTIDGCLQLRPSIGGATSSIVKVELRTHPLVLELTGKIDPQTGLEGKFSVYHAAAVALLHGDASPTAFTDEMVRDPRVVALRRRVHVEPDPSIHESAVEVVVTLQDERRLTRSIKHAVGSVERPLSDDELNAKFRGQARRNLGDGGSDRLLELAWRLPELEGVALMARAAVPAI